MGGPKSYYPAIAALILGVCTTCFKVAASPEKPRQTEIDVKTALSELLTRGKVGALGGFVVFVGKAELDYVQYALEADGLMLNWPTKQKGGAARLPGVINVLRKSGFAERKPIGDHDPRRQIDEMRKGQYIVFDDGLYAKAGKNVDELKSLTLALLKDVFGVTNENQISITLELENN